MKNFLSYDEKIEEKTNTFEKLMTIYEMAITELETKMKILQKEFKVFYNYDLIDHINTRIKAQYGFTRWIRAIPIKPPKKPPIPIIWALIFQ